MEGMDTIFTRLEEASRTGDVDSLKKLLEEDHSMLDRVIARTSRRDNPLHIAALSGQADFTAEIIIRKPELANELNGQGLSPLHLAAAHGHLLVVKELLKVGIHLCLVRDKKDGLMPLHVAVIKERPLIIKELVEAYEGSVHQLTHLGETILHLAVKSNSFDALEFLISRVHDINAKNEKGNTVLHLAVARKQLLVIKLLLSNPSIDANSKNYKGSTPLDILLESQQEYGDLVIGEMIRAASGKTTNELVPQHEITIHEDSNPSPQSSMSNKPTDRPLGSNGNFEKANKEKRDNKSENKNNNPDLLMVVAALIATITFQAAINPPGGFFQDGDNKGQVILAGQLKLFLIFDMVGLFLSVSVILLLLCVVPRKRNIVSKFLVLILWLSILSTALAFTNAVGQTFIYSMNAVKIMNGGWLVLLMLGMLWVSIRLIIRVCKVKRPFRHIKLNGSTKTTNRKQRSICLKIGSIVIVLLANVVSICFKIGSIIFILLVNVIIDASLVYAIYANVSGNYFLNQS